MNEREIQEVHQDPHFWHKLLAFLVIFAALISLAAYCQYQASAVSIQTPAVKCVYPANSSYGVKAEIFRDTEFGTEYLVFHDKKGQMCVVRRDNPDGTPAVVSKYTGTDGSN